MKEANIAVIIPAFRTKEHILQVLNRIGSEVNYIIVVDDACPMQTGNFVKNNFFDKRLILLQHEINQGVGGAMISGYQYVLKNKHIDIAVKIDSDGQMDPALIPSFVKPLLEKEVEYTKGNRFFRISDLEDMPTHRIIGNAGLSFASKFASGYWKIFDPANGYTAITKKALQTIDLDLIDRGYFFETDMLCQLGLNRIRIKDIPMKAVYGKEQSGLIWYKNLFPFCKKMSKNFFRRIFYQYYLQNFNIASVELFFGFIFLCFGIGFGAYRWILSSYENVPATGGQVMLAALPIIIGFQLVLAFLSYDSNNEPI